MRNLGRQFKDYQLNFVKEDGFGNHLIEAYHNKAGHIANLEWDRETGTIRNVDVAENHRRQGLATAMFNHAKELHSLNKNIPIPVHSAARTPEGDAWARSVGGKGLGKKACTSCGDEGHLATEHA